jgi:DNA-binding NtrC family response regulator
VLRLIARCGRRVRVFPFPAGEAVLGAAEDSDLVLPFPGVSRRHARLLPVGRDLLLVDLESRNGLVCGGERLPQALLARGGEVHLGGAALSLEEIPSSEAEPELPIAWEPERIAPRPTSTLEPAVEARSPRAALRLIRSLARSAGGAGPGLAAALPILGAEALLRFHPAGDDLAVVECHGPLPSDAVARALAGAAEAEPQGDLLRIDVPEAEATILLGGCGADGARLAAVFAAPGPGAGGWERDLFEYLASHLGAAGSPPAAARGAPEPALRLAPGMIPGASPAAAALLAAIEAAARGRRDVLVLGETGVGKELAARTLHASGPAADGPFLAINCAAIPAELAEAELFGIHGRVATGVDPRPGLFVRACGGTLFLDEVGELAPELQAKLLRVLEEREVLPLGAPAPRRIEVRVVSASNRDLAAEVAAGRFRADLYYRLRGVEILVPPLRERRADIPLLAAAFAARAAAAQGKRILGIGRAALALLVAHDWPGNLRQLASEMERAALLCPEGGVLATDHLSVRPAEREAPAAPALAGPAPPATLGERIAALEREAVTAALAASGGNKASAARALGLTRNGLNLKLKRLGLAPEKP